MTARTEAELFQEFAELALNSGRADVAGECLRRAALGRTPEKEKPEQLHAAGIQFLNTGNLSEAEMLLSRAIRQKPSNADWHDHLGVVLAKQKRLLEAEATFRLAIRLNANLSSVRRNLAQCLVEQQAFDKAELALREAIEHEPNEYDLLLQLAGLMPLMKRPDEGLKILRELSEKHANQPEVWNRLGVQLGEQGLLEEAEKAFRKQIQLDPTGGSGYANLAAALGKQKKWLDAVEVGLESTRREPLNPQGWANLGNAQRDLGRLNEALKSLTEAVRLDPNNAEAAGNLALTIAMMARPQEALPWYDHALKLKPDAADIHFNRAVAYLWLGDYERGWQDYEWRWLTEQMKNLPRKFPAPVWDGSPLNGKTILVHSEQGHGDTIQFCRLAPLLTAQGAKVLFTAPPSLAELLRTLPGIGEVITNHDGLTKYDVHCPLMSLPGRLGIRLNNIPGTPYLTAPAYAVQKWHARLKELPGRKIGLVWQGNPGHIGDRFRSIPLKLFEPLMSVPNITWISLQKGPGSEQLDQFSTWPIHRFGEELTDFTDTAGLLQNLDLLISVDTATVHLMGAINKPVWPMISFNNDWRWLMTRRDSPWYLSARLFRQPKFGDWPAVVEQVKLALERPPT